MADFIITQNHLLSKIGQLTMENEVLRAQLNAVTVQFNELNEAIRKEKETKAPEETQPIRRCRGFGPVQKPPVTE